MSVNKVNQSTGELSPIAGGTLYADAPVGSIQAYGGTTAPWGWLLCQGQAISRTTYAELFGVIGTSFGEGDGSTTFNVPDLRGEFLRGAGTNSHNNQGSGGTVGQHQDATQIPDIYIAGNGTLLVTPAADTLWRITDAELALTTGYKTVGLSGSGTTNIPSHYSARPTNTSVNFIIKATTIALPSDFEAAVDDKIADNMIDSITDGNMKAATSNAVYNIIAPKNYDVASSYTYQNRPIKFVKSGNVVTVMIEGLMNLPTADSILSIIPESCRMKTQSFVYDVIPNYVNGAVSDGPVFRISINPSNNVLQIYNYLGITFSAANIYITFSYIII